MTSLPKLEANELRHVSEIIEDILNSQLAVEDSQESFQSLKVICQHIWRWKAKIVNQKKFTKEKIDDQKRFNDDPERGDDHPIGINISYEEYVIQRGFLLGLFHPKLF